MKAHFRAAIAALSLTLATATSTAALPTPTQTVYRCGNAYADTPCPRATVVDVDDPRSLAQQADARDVAGRESALAARMSSDRQQAQDQARAAKPAISARVKASAHAASAPVRVAQRSRTRFRQDNGQGDFVAIAPRPAKK